jgi:uncharacterized protein YbaP (TraB family)
MKRLLRLVLGVALFWACALPVAAEPPMWRARGPNGAQVVLFGSVHILTDEARWRSPALDAALAQADTVWFETPFDAESRAEASRLATAKSQAPRGRSLTSYLSRADQALLARVAARVGLPMETLQPMRPWYAEMLISVAEVQRVGGRQALGVEEQISGGLPPTTRRRAFETAAQQVTMFADASPREQAASLVMSLRELEEDPEGFSKLQKAWVDGDVGFLAQEAVAPMKQKAPRLYRRWVTTRNRAWTATIEGLLKGSEQAFIVVGVGHLIGPDSVPAMLRRKGFAVEGP